MNRRQFFKLAAAGAAVALVPMHIIEAATDALTLKQNPRLWFVQSMMVHFPGMVEAIPVVDRRDPVFMRHPRVAREFPQVDLELRRGNFRVALSMYAMEQDRTRHLFDALHADDGIEFDLAWEGVRPRGHVIAIVGGKRLAGIRSLEIHSESDFVEYSYLDQVHRRPLPDTTDIDGLTISKQLRGEVP